jgi:hypothetical protein
MTSVSVTSLSPTCEQSKSFSSSPLWWATAISGLSCLRADCVLPPAFPDCCVTVRSPGLLGCARETGEDVPTRAATTQLQAPSRSRFMRALKRAPEAWRVGVSGGTACADALTARARAPVQPVFARPCLLTIQDAWWLLPARQPLYQRWVTTLSLQLLQRSSQITQDPERSYLHPSSARSLKRDRMQRGLQRQLGEKRLGLPCSRTKFTCPGNPQFRGHQTQCPVQMDPRALSLHAHTGL